MFTTPFTLSGLHCDACVKVSKVKISDIPGVQNVRLEGHGSEASGEVDAERQISLEEIQQSLDGSGYKVSAR